MAFKVRNPYEVLARVIEVKTELVGSSSEGFRTGELELFNEIFVRGLSESLAFLGI